MLFEKHSKWNVSLGDNRACRETYLLYGERQAQVSTLSVKYLELDAIQGRMGGFTRATLSRTVI